MAFGGAGGLFATLLAKESEIPRVVIPPFSGNFSAWGLLGADVTQTAAQTMIAPLTDESTGTAEKVSVTSSPNFEAGRGEARTTGPRQRPRSTSATRARSTASPCRCRSLPERSTPTPLGSPSHSRSSTRGSSGTTCRSESRSSPFAEHFEPRRGSGSIRQSPGPMAKRTPSRLAPTPSPRKTARIPAGLDRASLPLGATLTGPALIAEETLRLPRQRLRRHRPPELIVDDRAAGGRSCLSRRHHTNGRFVRYSLHSAARRSVRRRDRRSRRPLTTSSTSRWRSTTGTSAALPGAWAPNFLDRWATASRARSRPSAKGLETATSSSSTTLT